MLSWKVWHTLQHPPRTNPIFHWMLKRRRPAAREFRFAIIVVVGSIIGLGCLAIAARLLLVNLLLVLMSAPALILAGTVVIALLYCTGLSGAVSTGIQRIREQQIYETLCITPPGIFGTTWTIAAGISHRHQGFFWFRLFVQTVAGSLIIGMVFTLGAALLVMLLSHSEIQSTLLEIINVLLMCLALYIGCIQAFSSSILVGMLVPLSVAESMPLYIITVGLYLLMEMYILLIAGLVGILLIPVTLEILRINGPAVDMLLPFLRVVIFCGLHEIINRIVWHILRERLNLPINRPIFLKD